MPNISGRVIFDRNRSASIDSGDSGIANVQIVLQNILDGSRLTVLTDTLGNYSFINVPAGNYRLVEAYGDNFNISLTGDFTEAQVGQIPVGFDPPITLVTNPPIESTNIDSITPNTIYLEVGELDIINQDFFDGPVRYIPLMTELDSCSTVSENVITDADNGTFGYYDPGTPANSSPAVNPYPDFAPDFQYVQLQENEYSPDGGQYTITNLLTNTRSTQIGAWWRIANHSTGTETGRMLVVNGDRPQGVIFQTTVNVKPNTNYLFSAWILNLFKALGYANPQFGVEILDENGNTIYNESLGGFIPVNTEVPEWREIETLIQSGSNNTLTIRFYSEAEEAIGNDYAIDDINLYEIEIPEFRPVKSVNESVVNVGDIVTYSISIQNTCQSPLQNIIFTDSIPPGLEFVNGVAIINGIEYPIGDPTNGITLPQNILGGQSATIILNARAIYVPNPNPTNNVASITYYYTPVPDGIPEPYTRESNVVPVTIVQPIPEADILVQKTSSSSQIIAGESITYTLLVNNLGPSISENVILEDYIPVGIENVEFSLDGGITWNTWTGIYAIGSLGINNPITILIRGIVNEEIIGNIINTATVSSTTYDPNPDNNTSTIEVSILEYADLSVIKSQEPNPPVPGQLILYTINLVNLGPSASYNITITDDIPSSIISPEFSIDNGVTWNTWNGVYFLDELQNRESITLLIRGIVDPQFIGNLINTVNVSSETYDPDLMNNTSTVTSEIDQLADLGILKTVNSDNINAGDIIIYDIIVRNLGPSRSDNVFINDNISENIISPEVSIDGGITWSPWIGLYGLGTLQSGESITIQIRGRINPGFSGELINTATVTSTTPDLNPDNNTSTIVVQISNEADLSITKVGNPNPINIGEDVTYEIIINNLGPSYSQNVVLEDNVSENISNVEFSLDGGITWIPWEGSYNIGTLANGASRRVLIRGTVNSTALIEIINTSIVTSTTPDPNPDNNTSTSIIQVIGEGLADLCIIKTANKSNIIEGEYVIYTIKIYNRGPSNAENVKLRDEILQNISNVEYSINNGITWNNWQGFYNLGTLLSGEIRIINIRGKVIHSSMNQIINTAIVTSTTPDPNPDNNTSTTVINVYQLSDLCICKMVDCNCKMIGEILIYTIKIYNAGPSDSYNVNLIDDIPNSITNVEYSIDGGITWYKWCGCHFINRIPGGELVTILIKGYISDKACGSIINTAKVISETLDVNKCNNISTCCINIKSNNRKY